MRRLSGAVAGLFAFLAWGFIPASKAQQTPSASASRSSTSSDAARSQTVQAGLARTIRAKNAKVGDLVTARTVTALILPNQVVIPEGSKLIGHVVQASSGTGGQATTLALAFDRFELSKRQVVKVNLSIRSAAVPPTTAQPAALDEDAQGTSLPDTSSPPTTPKPRHMETVGGMMHSPKNGPDKPQVPPLDTASGGDGRGDLRAMPPGTLMGMPGVRLRLDEGSGAATFASTNPKLELKSGLQLMLSVGPTATVDKAMGGSKTK